MASLSHSPLFRLKLLRRSTTPPSTSDGRHDGMGFAAPFKNVRRLGRRKGTRAHLLTRSDDEKRSPAAACGMIPGMISFLFFSLYSYYLLKPIL